MPEDMPILFFRPPSEHGPLMPEDKTALEWTRHYWPGTPIVGSDGRPLETEPVGGGSQNSAGMVSFWRALIRRPYSIVVLPRKELRWRLLLSLTSARKRIVVQPFGMIYTFSFGKLAVNQIARIEFLLSVLLLPATLLASFPLSVYLLVRFVQTGRMRSLLRRVRKP